MTKKKSIHPRSIALIGVLMAGELILTRFFAIETPFIRISFAFIPTILMAVLFGPLLTATASAITDIVGAILFSKGAAFFPGFTLTAFLSGLIYGYFFYKKELTWERIIVVNLIVIILSDLILNTLWLYLMLGPVVLAQFPLRLAKACVLLPIRILVTHYLANQQVVQNQIIKFQA